MTDTSPASQAGLFEHGRSGMVLDDYDYPLPEELIARYPLARRDQSRMLVLDRVSGEVIHARFLDLPGYLSPGDLMVLNNTKVLPTRFFGHRAGHTGKVEALLLHPLGGEPGATPHSSPPPQGERRQEGGLLDWSALVRPARKLKPGTIIELPGTEATLEILESGERGQAAVRVHLAECSSVPELMEKAGQMPIPPYLRREAEESDKQRYQTVFSRIPGAQAAPTAGLHFTPEVLETLSQKGVNQAEVTLAVSAGTFRTVEDERIENHRMDPEAYAIPPETVSAVVATRAGGGKILAVGTTVAKTLETSAYRHGQVLAESTWSDLFIYPGFEFKVVDRLLTNFHLPKSTLLMLISAFAGRENVAEAYRQALAENYRFYSYGDCMLIL